MIPLEIRQIGNAALLLREAIALHPVGHQPSIELERKAMALLVASLAEQGYSLEDFDGSEDNDEGL